MRGHGLLGSAYQAVAARTACGTQASAAFGFAGLLVELTDADFFFDTATLDELAKTADGLLGGFFIP